MKASLWQAAQRFWTRFDWYRWLRQQSLVILGSLVAALGYSLFQVPFSLTAGGTSGLAIVITYFTELREGTLFFLLNIPLIILGYYNLGRWRFVISTMVCLVVFSVATEVFLVTFPEMLEEYPLTENILLSAIYAGISFGVGAGLVFRAGATFPGTTIVGRIIQNRTGYPLSQIFLYTDSLIIISGGIVFGWEVAMLALLTLFLAGMASDFVVEGSSQIRTVMVITEHPESMKQALMAGLGKGITQWDVTGAYTRQNWTMLYCVISRAQVDDVKYIVAQTDGEAFVVIGVAHQAFGGMSFPMVKGR